MMMSQKMMNNDVTKKRFIRTSYKKTKKINKKLRISLRRDELAFNLIRTLKVRRFHCTVFSRIVCLILFSIL
jgi:hypothetical protein